MGRHIGRGNLGVLQKGLIFLLVGATMAGIGLKDFIGYSGHLLNFNEIQTNDCQVGDYVEGNINLVLGWYCEEESKRNGVTTRKSRY